MREAHAGDAFAGLEPGHAAAWNLNRWRANKFTKASSGLVHLTSFVTASRTREVTLGEMGEMAISDEISDEAMAPDEPDGNVRMELAPTFQLTHFLTHVYRPPTRTLLLTAWVCRAHHLGQVRRAGPRTTPP